MANGAILGQTTNTYSKEQIMASTIPALFGLGSGAVPSDVLAWIGKYNQHWWRRRTSSISEKDSAKTVVCASSSSSSGIYCTYNYSSGAQKQGENIILSDPVSTINIGYGVNGTTSRLNGKYFTLESTHGEYSEIVKGRVYKGKSSVSRVLDGTYQCYITCSEAYVSYGDWEYVQSSTRNQYPDSGEQDEYEYQYLGIPFANAATTPKIATGSYIGTGKYGQSNPSSLTFEFTPKIVIITYDGTGAGGGIVFINGQSEYANWGSDASSAGSSYGHITWNGNTISWWSTSNQQDQFNASMDKYRYFAIG